MNRRTFLQMLAAAALVVRFGKHLPLVDDAAALPTPPAPQEADRGAQPLMTVPFFVGRPRDEKVFMPVIQHK